jgi:hypothetical protein
MNLASRSATIPTRRPAMSKALASFMTGILLLSVVAAHAQEGRATPEDVARALGAGGVRSIEYTGNGATFAVGQSTTPGAPWPPFNLRSYARAVNYETASLREERVLSRADTLPGEVACRRWARRGRSS